MESALVPPSAHSSLQMCAGSAGVVQSVASSSRCRQPFRRFDDRVPAEHRDTLLDEVLYTQLLHRSGPSTCATGHGYKVPPMLGGSGEFDNIEPWDGEVHLSFVGQALAQTR